MFRVETTNENSPGMAPVNCGLVSVSTVVPVLVIERRAAPPSPVCPT
jgi:hypothetical protein